MTVLDDQMTNLNDKIRTTQLAVTGVVTVLVLVYLVPSPRSPATRSA